MGVDPLLPEVMVHCQSGGESYDHTVVIVRKRSDRDSAWSFLRDRAKLVGGSVWFADLDNEDGTLAYEMEV